MLTVKLIIKGHNLNLNGMKINECLEKRTDNTTQVDLEIWPKSFKQTMNSTIQNSPVLESSPLLPPLARAPRMLRVLQTTRTRTTPILIFQSPATPPFSCLSSPAVATVCHLYIRAYCTTPLRVELVPQPYSTHTTEMHSTFRVFSPSGQWSRLVWSKVIASILNSFSEKASLYCNKSRCSTTLKP